MTNYATMPDDELVAAMHAIQAEHSRRTTLKLAQDSNVGLTDVYLTTIGRAPGQPWVQPLGAHDAYAKDAKVTHKGRIWTSTAANNTWEPGVYGWVDIGPA